MKTYKELVDGLYEEVSKIDVSKLPLSSYGGGLKDYVELLKAMSDLPPNDLKEKMGMCCSMGLGVASVPKIEETKPEK